MVEEGKPRDECGVIGIYAPGKKDIARAVYFGLRGLQHRGQESAGIAVNRDGKIKYHKAAGLVQEVFNDEIIEGLRGNIAVGHVRYPAGGETQVVNAMPLVIYYKGGALALAHNGSLVNGRILREEIQNGGFFFQTTIDAETIAALIARNMRVRAMETAFRQDDAGDARGRAMEESILAALDTIKGAYALVMTTENKLIGARDPNGIRPLCLGETKDGFLLSSESCIFSLLEAKMVRDVEPGEMIVIENGAVRPHIFAKDRPRTGCSFEYVYLARPDSDIDKRNVYMARGACGRKLAKEAPVSADMVISVPDSGTVAAIGYAEEAGIPYGEGFIKNRYVGRSFIEPDQRTRELAVRLKLNVIANNVEGKRIIIVDDSIIRGTTSMKIVSMLREAGATEVHMRIASPPVTHRCFYGIDTPDEGQLVASVKNPKEISDMIGTDSLAFLSLAGMMEAIALGNQVCAACFDGKYPTELPESDLKWEEGS